MAISISSAEHFAELVTSTRTAISVPTSFGRRLVCLPTELLQRRWQWFDDQPLKLGSTLTIDCTAVAFDIFIVWLYTQQIPSKAYDQPHNDESVTWPFLDAWLFRQAYSLPRFQNQIMRKLCELVTTHRSEPSMTLSDVRHVSSRRKIGL